MPTCRYHYDPLDRLAARTDSAQDSTRHFYQASRLATAIGNHLQRTILATDRQLLAQKDVSTAGERSHLLATDQQDSVLTAISTGQLTDIAYSPYGQRQDLEALPGFAGQESDPLTGHYLLGNGYRAYNPVLRRFNSPDSLSPFGRGGLNAYAYCSGDPVNRVDPTGQFPWSGALREIERLTESLLESALRNPSRLGAGAVIVGGASTAGLLASGVPQVIRTGLAAAGGGAAAMIVTAGGIAGMRRMGALDFMNQRAARQALGEIAEFIDDLPRPSDWPPRYQDALADPLYNADTFEPPPLYDARQLPPYPQSPPSYADSFSLQHTGAAGEHQVQRLSALGIRRRTGARSSR